MAGGIPVGQAPTTGVFVAAGGQCAKQSQLAVRGGPRNEQTNPIWTFLAQKRGWSAKTKPIRPGLPALGNPKHEARNTKQSQLDAEHRGEDWVELLGRVGIMGFSLGVTCGVAGLRKNPLNLIRITARSARLRVGRGRLRRKATDTVAIWTRSSLPAEAIFY